MSPHDEAVAEYQNMPELEPATQIELAILLLKYSQEEITESQRVRITESMGRPCLEPSGDIP